MSKAVKIATVVLIVLMLVTGVSTVFATTVTPEQMTGESSVDVSGITGLGNSIISIISTIGIVASVIVLIVLGIKYMMGSVEEQAKYKATMMPYVIGAALVFAASTIAQIIYQFMQNV